MNILRKILICIVSCFIMIVCVAPPAFASDLDSRSSLDSFSPSSEWPNNDVSGWTVEDVQYLDGTVYTYSLSKSYDLDFGLWSKSGIVSDSGSWFASSSVYVAGSSSIHAPFFYFPECMSVTYTPVVTGFKIGYTRSDGIQDLMTIDNSYGFDCSYDYYICDWDDTYSSISSSTWLKDDVISGSVDSMTLPSVKVGSVSVPDLESVKQSVGVSFRLQFNSSDFDSVVPDGASIRYVYALGYMSVSLDVTADSTGWPMNFKPSDYVGGQVIEPFKPFDSDGSPSGLVDGSSDYAKFEGFLNIASVFSSLLSTWYFQYMLSAVLAFAVMGWFIHGR